MKPKKIEIDWGTLLLKIFTFFGAAILVDLICFFPLKGELSPDQLDAFLIGTPILFIVFSVINEVLYNLEERRPQTSNNHLALFFTSGCSIIAALITLYFSPVFKHMTLTWLLVSIVAGYVIGIGVYSLFHVEAVFALNKVVGCCLSIILFVCIYLYLYVILLGGALLLILFLFLAGACART